MRFPEVVETSRLQLRRPQVEDAKAIFEAYAQDPAVTRYLVWRPHQSIRTTNEFIGQCLDRWSARSAFPYVITRESGAPAIGMLEVRPEPFKATIGYVLARPYWGQGFMPEAAGEIVRLVLSDPSMYRVEAFCDVENAASARTLEKAGMIREGVMRRYIIHPTLSNEPRDCFLYAATR
jgi:[ribosomal protein S5]-alanine N-acetyltransferase